METSKRQYNVDITRLPVHQLKIKSIPKLTKIPASVDLRPKMPPVYDQGQLGSCTANALAAAYEYCDNNAFLPSLRQLNNCLRTVISMFSISLLNPFVILVI